MDQKQASSPIPISDEQAKAIQETAKLASKIVDAGGGIGRYLDRVFGHVPDNLVGYFGGDYLAEVRTRNAERLRADTDEIRRRRGTQERVDVSPSVAIPLVQAAIDEDRDGLKELWAKLLANAMDPKRTHLVRPSLIELLKQFDPLDAVVLQELTGPRVGNLVPRSLILHSLHARWLLIFSTTGSIRSRPRFAPGHASSSRS